MIENINFIQQNMNFNWLEIKLNWIQFETALLLMLRRAEITDITLSRRCTCKIGIVDRKIQNLQPPKRVEGEMPWKFTLFGS